MSAMNDPHENRTRVHHPNVVDLNELLGWAADHLPEYWEVEIRCVHGEASLSLGDNEGHDVEVNTDDMTTVEAFIEHVNFARRACGMVEALFTEDTSP